MITEFPGDTLPLPTQAIFPGLLESACRRELQNLFSKNVLARLWAKDTSLWPAEDYQAESGLARFAGQLWPLLARVVSRAENDGNPFSGASFYYPGGRKFLSGPAPRGI